MAPLPGLHHEHRTPACRETLSGLVIHHASGTAYLAGQVAEDPTADVSGQTRQVLALIDGLLAEAGSDKTKILSATIFLPTSATSPR
jgi:enamine deaminase RidA (YjgF/YER057c/UK114 family)